MSPVREALLEAPRWWIVRAGEGAVAFKRFSSESIVAAGSSTPYFDNDVERTESELRSALLRADSSFPEYRAREVVDFCLGMSIGDGVVTPNKGGTEFLIRLISSDFYCVGNDPNSLHIHRKVRPGLLRKLTPEFEGVMTLGRTGTVFRASDERTKCIQALVRRES